jgi:hypothetical protein
MYKGLGALLDVSRARVSHLHLDTNGKGLTAERIATLESKIGLRAVIPQCTTGCAVSEDTSHV